MEGDPQTRLQDDKDPMLIVRGRAAQGRTVESELDPDPEGDLGMLIWPQCRFRDQIQLQVLVRHGESLPPVEV